MFNYNALLTFQPETDTNVVYLPHNQFFKEQVYKNTHCVHECTHTQAHIREFSTVGPENYFNSEVIKFKVSHAFSCQLKYRNNRIPQYLFHNLTNEQGT